MKEGFNFSQNRLVVKKTLPKNRYFVTGISFDEKLTKTQIEKLNLDESLYLISQLSKSNQLEDFFHDQNFNTLEIFQLASQIKKLKHNAQCDEIQLKIDAIHMKLVPVIENYSLSGNQQYALNLLLEGNNEARVLYYYLIENNRISDSMIKDYIISLSADDFDNLSHMYEEVFEFALLNGHDLNTILKKESFVFKIIEKTEGFRALGWPTPADIMSPQNNVNPIKLIHVGPETINPFEKPSTGFFSRLCSFFSDLPGAFNNFVSIMNDQSIRFFKWVFKKGPPGSNFCSNGYNDYYSLLEMLNVTSLYIFCFKVLIYLYFIYTVYKAIKHKSK
jgi:hypothetical protein